METIKSDSYLKTGDKVYISKSPYILELCEHMHNFFEIVYICSGNAKHIINEREYNTSFGDLFMLNYSDAHTFKEMSSDFTIITCAFLPELIDNSMINLENAQDLIQNILFSPFSEQHSDYRFNINLMKKHGEFGKIFEDMNTEYSYKEKGYQIILRGLLTILLAKIFRAIAQNNIEKKSSKDREMIEKALDYLKCNYSKPFKVEDIARLVLFSPGYFTTVFKNVTGTTLTEYLHKIRIAEACRLLNGTDMSVYDIINEVGYNDRKFFYSVFKRHIGMTPGQYRKLTLYTDKLLC